MLNRNEFGNAVLKITDRHFVFCDLTSVKTDKIVLKRRLCETSGYARKSGITIVFPLGSKHFFNVLIQSKAPVFTYIILDVLPLVNPYLRTVCDSMNLRSC